MTFEQFEQARKLQRDINDMKYHIEQLTKFLDGLKVEESKRVSIFNYDNPREKVSSVVLDKSYGIELTVKAIEDSLQKLKELHEEFAQL